MAFYFKPAIDLILSQMLAFGEFIFLHPSNHRILYEYFMKSILALDSIDVPQRLSLVEGSV